MRLATFQFVTDLHQKYTAVFLGDQVLALLRGLVRIKLLKFLGGDEGDVVRKLFYCLRVLVPHLMLHVLDDLEDCANSLLKCLDRALFAGDNALPVPLVDVAGVQVVKLLVTADCVHVRVETFPWLEAILFECHTLPFCEGVNNLNRLSWDTGDVKRNRTLHTV